MPERKQLNLATLTTVEGYRIALTDHNSLVVVAPTGERGFPELTIGIRRRDASPIRLLGRLHKVPKAVEDVVVGLLKKQGEARRRWAQEHAGEDDDDNDFI